jgi:predicted MFS family arabinose efflux permease
VAGRFLGAAATPIYNVDSLSLRQARVSQAIMGRVNGTFQFLEWGALPVGSLLGGVLGSALGPRAALAVAAACGLVSAIWIATSPARHLTTLEGARIVPDGLPAGTAAVISDPAHADQDDPALRPPLVA